MALHLPRDRWWLCQHLHFISAESPTLEFKRFLTRVTQTKEFHGTSVVAMTQRRPGLRYVQLDINSVKAKSTTKGRRSDHDCQILTAHGVRENCERHAKKEGNACKMALSALSCWQQTETVRSACCRICWIDARISLWYRATGSRGNSTGTSAAAVRTAAAVLFPNKNNDALRQTCSEWLVFAALSIVREAHRKRVFMEGERREAAAAAVKLHRSSPGVPCSPPSGHYLLECPRTALASHQLNVLNGDS